MKLKMYLNWYTKLCNKIFIHPHTRIKQLKAIENIKPLFVFQNNLINFYAMNNNNNDDLKCCIMEHHNNLK